MGMNDIVIAARRVSKTFGATRALRDVSLAIRASEVHCLLGENGAGKSTLAKIIGGLVRPDEGELEEAGRPVRFRSIADARAKGIGMVFQELSLAPDLTVLENISLGSEPGIVPFRLKRSRQEKALCRSLLEQFDLDFDLDARVRGLSAAKQQLLEVSKALMQRPRILLLDEPTAMLGVHEKRKLLGMIRRARNDGVAIVFVTHHIEDVLEVADHVSLMRNGALVESFAAGPELTAAGLVEKLVGSQKADSAVANSRDFGREMFAIYALPGSGGRSVDIAICAGEIVGLYGVVGCGIDAIRDLAIGASYDDRTPLALDGERVRLRSVVSAAKLGISYLPSGRAANGILPTLTIRENLTLGQPAIFGRLLLTSLRREQANVRTQLERLRTRLASQEDLITALSGGNQQKVLLGRCIERGGKLLVLEDPTAGVDIGAKREIHDLIRARAAAGQAVLLLSNDLQETIALCNTIYTVHGSELIGCYRDPKSTDEPKIIVDILGASPPAVPPISSEAKQELRHV